MQAITIISNLTKQTQSKRQK